MTWQHFFVKLLHRKYYYTLHNHNFTSHREHETSDLEGMYVNNLQNNQLFLSTGTERQSKNQEK
jgi:hypothetical protein